MAVSSPCASAGESCTAKPTSSACFRVTNPTDKQRRQQDGGSHGDIGTPHMDEHGGGRRAAGDITAVGYRPRREPLAPGLQVFRRVDRRPPRGRESGEGAQDRIGRTMIAAETLLAERLDDLGTDATPDRDKLRRAFLALATVYL